MKDAKIQIYTGDGKGKTTASIGLAVRAAGNGLNVKIAQFLKGTHTSEMEIFDIIENIELHRATKSKKFIFNMTEEERLAEQKSSQCLLEKAIRWITDDATDVIIFDEILGALSNEFVLKEDIEKLLDQNTTKTEIVLTGRDAPQWLIDRADLVSEIKCIKHYMDKGVNARKGIEF